MILAQHLKCIWHQYREICMMSWTFLLTFITLTFIKKKIPWLNFTLIYFNVVSYISRWARYFHKLNLNLKRMYRKQSAICITIIYLFIFLQEIGFFPNPFHRVAIITLDVSGYIILFSKKKLKWSFYSSIKDLTQWISNPHNALRKITSIWPVTTLHVHHHFCSQTCRHLKQNVSQNPEISFNLTYM